MKAAFTVSGRLVLVEMRMVCLVWFSYFRSYPASADHSLILHSFELGCLPSLTRVLVSKITPSMVFLYVTKSCGAIQVSNSSFLQPNLCKETTTTHFFGITIFFNAFNALGSLKETNWLANVVVSIKWITRYI